MTAAFTNYNRTELLFEAIAPFLADDRITEIIISDDCSQEDIYQTVLWKYNGADKVKIYRNETNLDCYRNKKKAVSLASNEWVLLLDSDNIFSPHFIDVIFEQDLKKNVAYAPEWAMPHFNFTELSGVEIKRSNVANLLDKGQCSTMLNAMNYLVNREEYLRTFGLSGNLDPVTSDSIFQNYNWLKGGNSIYVVPGLRYEHRVHTGSHYQNNVKRTPSGFHDSIIDKLKQMK